MATKETILDWFVRHFILPNYKNYKVPGFIIVSFKNQARQEVYFREVLIPESLMIAIEDGVVNALGDKGKQLLYDIGVTLGTNFARQFGFPNVKDNTKEEIDKYFNFTLKFNFSTWCKDAQITEYEIENKKVSLEIDEHVICRKNGRGHILTEGAQAGMAKHLLRDADIEVVQTKCQGRGDEKCKIVWRTSNEFNKENVSFLRGKSLYTVPDFTQEKKFNTIQKSYYAKKATYDMIKSGIFKLDKGKIQFKEQVFFDCTVLLYYLLEKYLQNNKQTAKVLYEAGFNYGRKISKDQPLDFVPHLLSALGWGATMITKKDGKLFIQMQFFPWSQLVEEGVKFNLFKGLISGMLTETAKRPINITKVKKSVKSYLILEMTE